MHCFAAAPMGPQGTTIISRAVTSHPCCRAARHQADLHIHVAKAEFEDDKWGHAAHVAMGTTSSPPVPNVAAAASFSGGGVKLHAVVRTGHQQTLQPLCVLPTRLLPICCILAAAIAAASGRLPAALKWRCVPACVAGCNIVHHLRESQHMSCSMCRAKQPLANAAAGRWMPE